MKIISLNGGRIAAAMQRVSVVYLPVPSPLGAAFLLALILEHPTQ